MKKGSKISVCFIIILLFPFFSLSVLSNEKEPTWGMGDQETQITIWNISTKGDIVMHGFYRDEIVGYADGKGTITIETFYTVQSEDVLIIESGVKIKYLNKHWDMHAYGLVIMNGTKNKPIIFEGAVLNLLAHPSTSKSIIKYTNFENSDLFIQNGGKQNISNNNFNDGGIIIGGSNSQPNVIGNSFHEGSIIIQSQANPLIKNNNLINSEIKSEGANPIIEKNILIDSSVRISGLYSGDNSKVFVKNNTITNNRYGIYISEKSIITIENNNISSNFIGIYCDYGTESYIHNNQLFNNDVGIYLSEIEYSMVINNKIFQNKFGLKIEDSSDIIFNYNLIYENEYGVISINTVMPDLQNNTFAYEGRSNTKGIGIQEWLLEISITVNNDNNFKKEYVKIFVEDKLGNKYTPDFIICSEFHFNVKEYEILNNGTKSFNNPYSIKVTYQNIESTKENIIINKDSEKRYIIVLENDLTDNSKIISLLIVFIISIVLIIILIFKKKFKFRN